MLSDTEKFLTGSGSFKNSLSEVVLPGKVQAVINGRKSYNGHASDLALAQNHVAIHPVYADDAFGSLYIFSDHPVSGEDERLLKVCAKILGNQMQKY